MSDEQQWYTYKVNEITKSIRLGEIYRFKRLLYETDFPEFVRRSGYMAQNDWELLISNIIKDKQYRYIEIFLNYLIETDRETTRDVVKWCKNNQLNYKKMDLKRK